MAFRKKLDAIMPFMPDILVIQECEHLNKLGQHLADYNPSDQYWFGDNPNKGVGVFGFNGVKIERLSIHNEAFRYIIPLRVVKDSLDFMLFAVWCQKPSKGDNYGIHTWNAINYYSDLMDNKPSIMVGDFNSSSIWDKRNREANHSNIVRLLYAKGISSVYHEFFDETQGQEKQPSLYLQKNQNKPYHIDFCFCSSSFSDNVQHVQIGTFEEWIQRSDHMPLIVQFDIKHLIDTCFCLNDEIFVI